MRNYFFHFVESERFRIYVSLLLFPPPFFSRSSLGKMMKRTRKLHTVPTANSVLDWFAGFFVKEEHLLKGSKNTMRAWERITPGYHWVEDRYKIPIWQQLYYNGFWFMLNKQLLVGKDWRGNMFFISENPQKLTGHERYGVFIEHWETEQDYDTDPLWRKWLQYRVAAPPSPEQCAKFHKYTEEKYSMISVIADRLKEQNLTDPAGERTRRYQEYVDQKWDVRRTRQVYSRAKSQSWYSMVMNNPEVSDRDFYARQKAGFEAWNFMNLDLLRPPRKQRLWKLEEDARAQRYINAIDNPNYQLDPFETTRKEVCYLLFIICCYKQQ